MIRGITLLALGAASVAASNTTIGCDVCVLGLEKAFDLGCGAGASALSAVCLDAAPACLAAFEELCYMCDSDCDISCWSSWACAHVDLCPPTNCATEPVLPGFDSSSGGTYYAQDPTESETKHLRGCA